MKCSIKEWRTVKEKNLYLTNDIPDHFLKPPCLHFIAYCNIVILCVNTSYVKSYDFLFVCTLCVGNLIQSLNNPIFLKSHVVFIVKNSASISIFVWLERKMRRITIIRELLAVSGYFLISDTLLITHNLLLYTTYHHSTPHHNTPHNTT